MTPRWPLAVIWLLLSALQLEAADGRLSLTTAPVMGSDVSSTTLYYATLDGSSYIAAPLGSANGLNDVYLDAQSLCLSSWANGMPPSSPGCSGQYVGTVNPVSGVARCDLTRKLAPRCDIWNFFNRQPITLEVGDPSNTPPPPSCCNVNGWYRVPGDRVVRNYWQNAGYGAVVMLGRPVERAVAQAQANFSLYTGNSYSPGTGILFYMLGLALDALPQSSADYCGYMLTGARHIDPNTTTSREVSADGASAPAVCNLPYFQGVKTVLAAESAGDNGMVLSSAARWSFQMTVRYSY